MQEQLTEQLLRDCVKEAQDKGQIGLLIWANWTAWDEFAFDMKKGNENYDFALSQIEKGEEATINLVWNSLTMPGFIAISAQKLGSSDELMKKVLDACGTTKYRGPITLVPMNKLSDNC